VAGINAGPIAAGRAQPLHHPVAVARVIDPRLVTAWTPTASELIVAPVAALG
jgi:hypothetical protein